MAQAMALAAPPQTSYDEVPYESYPFVQTHPDRLATVATLFGMKPKLIDQSRVLELGCAAGGNLIPMAVNLPDSQFLGIDLSSRQIGDGQRFVEALGVRNVELRHLSITDVTPDFGHFDYIICHGVYSWVPVPVQDKILDICRENLAPQGVAYVSYNTYPGWHMRGLLRDMMCYHANRFAEPRIKVGQARALLDFLAKSVSRKEGPYGMLLKEELDLLRGKADSYLLHEHLEDVNDPIYFYQFAERAQAKGLRYLGEAHIASMADRNFPQEVQQTLRRLSSNVIHMEQYMDFLRNRMFRQTLLCHKNVHINYTLGPEQMTQFHAASSAKPVSTPPEISSNKAEQFKGSNEITLTTSNPQTKAAMVMLAENWPMPVSFEQLRAKVHERLNPGVPEDVTTKASNSQLLGKHLLNCYTSSNLIELSVLPPRMVLEVSEKPIASPLARLQAESTATVTNQRHEVQKLNEVERHTLRYLDGTRDKAGLLELLITLVSRGVLVAKHQDQPIHDPERLRAVVKESLDQTLPRLARRALLIG